MKAGLLFHSCMFALLVLGIVLSTFSLVGAYLDSGDFLAALFADRGSEQIGLGIQGLRLFHYLVGGIAISTLSGGLLAMGKKENPFDSISLDSLSQSNPAALPIGTIEELEDAIDIIARTEEDSDLVKEIAAFKSTSSRNDGSRPPHASEKIDAKSMNSLIDGATVLLSKEQPASDSAE